MDRLPIMNKSDRRWRSRSTQNSKCSIIMIFLSCFACLYVAGRLWQNTEDIILLSNLVNKTPLQRHKILSVDERLAVLGCRDLERKISEVETDLLLAKSQGFFKTQRDHDSKRKFLAVIGIHTRFGSRLKRNAIRASWFSKGNVSRTLEQTGVVLRFVIGRSPNRGDSMDRMIDDENLTSKDFLILEDHEEAEEELSKKTKRLFSTAVQKWDAQFYVKLDDDIDLDLDFLIRILQEQQEHDDAYMGCMKSGDVITEEGKRWYEPEWWKFGDKKSYFSHAAGSIIILSKSLAEYIYINSDFLKTYAHDDISVGSWMLGTRTAYMDDSRLCCNSGTNQGTVC